MKNCPNCKAELEDNARFCLACMTSLEKKEQIQPPTRKKRWWLLVLVICAALCVAIIAVIMSRPSAPPEPQETTTTTNATTTTTADATTGTTLAPSNNGDERSYTDGSVTYVFRPATREEYPTAVSLVNHFTLIRVEGTAPNGVYQVPTFVGDDMNAIVCSVADGAFDGTNAIAIDLGYNVQYVWGSAFGGYSLTDLYLHDDVFIEQTAFLGCSEELTIHCPGYTENKQGDLWSELAAAYGFKWQSEIL